MCRSVINQQEKVEKLKYNFFFKFIEPNHQVTQAYFINLLTSQPLKSGFILTELIYHKVLLSYCTPRDSFGRTGASSV